jgi:hypothetical protein
MFVVECKVFKLWAEGPMSYLLVKGVGVSCAFLLGKVSDGVALGYGGSIAVRGGIKRLSEIF